VHARQLAEQNKNRLTVERQETLAPITVDPMRLRQILLNLLSKVTSEQGKGSVFTVRLPSGADT
jgi:signal transduction histidine kinase